MNYTHIANYDLQKDYINTLSDDEKLKLFYNLCSGYDELDEMDLEGKEVFWVTNNLVDWLSETPYDEIFIATITFKDCVTDEFLSQFDGDEHSYRVDYKEKEVKFIPRYDGNIFPNDAILADYYDVIPFDLTLIEHFSLGDG